MNHLPGWAVAEGQLMTISGSINAGGEDVAICHAVPAGPARRVNVEILAGADGRLYTRLVDPAPSTP